MRNMNLTPEQKEENQKLYNEMVSNIYLVDGNIVRATSMAEALKKAKEFNKNPLTIKKYEPKDTFALIYKIFEIIGQLNVLESHIDNNYFEGEIQDSLDIDYTLNRLEESYHHELFTMNTIVSYLKQVEEELTERWRLVTFIREERKENKTEKAA